MLKSFQSQFCEEALEGEFFYFLFFCEFCEGGDFDDFGILGFGVFGVLLLLLLFFFANLSGEATFSFVCFCRSFCFFASLVVVSIRVLFAEFDDVFMSFSGRFDRLEGLLVCSVLHSGV